MSNCLSLSRTKKTLQNLEIYLENKLENALVTINVFGNGFKYYDQDEWRGTKKLDGGALMNQASHYVDLLEWIIGPLRMGGNNYQQIRSLKIQQ